MRILKAFIITVILALTSVVYTQPPEETRMRIGHFAADLGPVDVYVNEEPTVTNFTFSSLSLWAITEEENLRIEILRAGATYGEDDPLIPAADNELEEGQWQTLTIIGQTVDESIRIHPIIEDYSPIGTGETRITVFNAIPGSFPVDAFAGNTRLVGGLGYPGSQGDNDGAFTVDIRTGSYDLRLEASAGNLGEIFALNNITLGTNRHYFLAAIGVRNNADGTLETTDLATFDAVIVQDTAPPVTSGTGSSFLRLGHFAPGTDGLDLYIDGVLVPEAQDAEYVSISRWVELESAVYEIAITANGAPIDQALIGPLDLVMEGGQWNTIAVVYNQELNSLIARTLREDYSPIPEGSGRITFFHAVPDAPSLDIAINQQVFINALTFPGNEPSRPNGAASITLGAGPIDIEIRETDNLQNVYIQLRDVELRPGDHYFIAAVNNVSTIDYYLQPVRQRDVIQRFTNP